MGGTPVFLWGGRPKIAHSQKLVCKEISQKVSDLYGLLSDA